MLAKIALRLIAFAAMVAAFAAAPPAGIFAVYVVASLTIGFSGPKARMSRPGPCPDGVLRLPGPRSSIPAAITGRAADELADVDRVAVVVERAAARRARRAGRSLVLLTPLFRPDLTGRSLAPFAGGSRGHAPAPVLGRHLGR